MPHEPHDEAHELGYNSIAELEQVRGPMGLRIERDLFLNRRRSPSVTEASCPASRCGAFS